MMVNLGIGTARNQGAQTNADADAEAMNGDAEEEAEGAEGEDEEAPPEADDRQLLSLVIEELEERFAGDEGEEKINEILQTVKDEFDRARSSVAGQNGVITNGT
jgi:hypothetical protein